MRLLRLKIVIIGDGTVGKTSIARRFSQRTFTHDYKRTIGTDFFSKRVQYNHKVLGPVTVDWMLWDLAGQPTWRDVRGNFYTGAKAAVVVFDITSRDSYEHVKNWIEELRKHVKDSIPILLVGNKIDLREEADNALTFEDGKKLAEELSNELGQEIPYIETSAKEGQNIDESFERLFNLIIDSYLKKVKSKS